MERGLLLIVSGPAGSGKSTVDNLLCSRPEFERSVSYTTRPPRAGEVNGREYNFVSEEEFLKLKAENALFESNCFCGYHYGSPRRRAEEVLASGRNFIMEIDVNGGMNMKKIFPEAVLIMLLPPSYSAQEKRLRGRGTEPEEKILARLARTKEELEFLPQYDYIVYNRDDGAAEAAEEICAIVRAEKRSIRRNPNAKNDYLAN